MKFFLKGAIVSTVLLLAQASFAAQAFPVSYGDDLAELLRVNCNGTLISDIVVVPVVEPKNVGWAGGVGGNIIGKITDSVGGADSVNILDLNSELPENTKALIFSVSYFNNKGAKLLFHEIASRDANDVIWKAPEKIVVEEYNYGTVLVCFDKNEKPVAIRAKISAENIHGSRPEVGITAYQGITIAPQN